jgi:hypothetical protein
VEVDVQACTPFQSFSARARDIAGEASGRITTNSSPP